MSSLCLTIKPAYQPDPGVGHAWAGAATGRLLDYYLHAAVTAGQHFALWVRTHRCPPPGNPPADIPGLSAAGQATAWLDAERPNLHAAVDYAAATGRSLYAVQIPAAISGFLGARGLWDQSEALHQIARAAARGSEAGPARQRRWANSASWPR